MLLGHTVTATTIPHLAPSEPAWHRRARAKRSTARLFLKLHKSELLLRSHHSAQRPAKAVSAMVGLGRWCELDKQAVPTEICRAIRDSKVCQEDIDRLKLLQKEARGEDGNLSGSQVSEHKLKLLSVHRIKAPAGKMRLYWPAGTPAALALKPTSGGKGKGYSKDKNWQDKKSNKEEAKSWERQADTNRKNRWNKSNNNNKSWKCSKCGQQAPELFLQRGKQWICLCCEYDSDRSDSDPGEVEEMDIQQEKDIPSGDDARIPEPEAHLAMLLKKMALQEEICAGIALGHSEKDAIRIAVDTEFQLLKQAVAEAKSRVRHVVSEEPDVKAKKKGLEQAIKAAETMATAVKGDLPVIKIFKEELAKLQPKPQEPELHNQLTKTRKALSEKQKEREKVQAAKSRQQTEVEHLHVSIAKLDRTMGKMDLEIIDFNQQIGSLVEGIRSLSVDSAAKEQPTPVATPVSPPTPDGLLHLIHSLGMNLSAEEVVQKLQQMNTGQKPAQPAAAAPPPPVQAVPEETGNAGTAPSATSSGVATEASHNVAPAVESHRGPTGNSAGRKQLKALTAASIDQKAAAARAATGSERQERLRVARASGESDTEENEESAAIRQRMEDEMDQQELP